MTETQERSLLAKIFISPDEPRLRAGWRLLIHTILLVVFGVVVGSIIYVVGLIGRGLQAAPLTGTTTELLNILVEVVIFTAATWVARRFLDRRSFASLGLKIDSRTILDMLFGIGLGGVLMGLIYAFESMVGWLHFRDFAWESASAGSVIAQVVLRFVFWIGVGYAEELLSRGYHLQNLWAGLNLIWALVISSGVFALLHIFNPGASWVSTLGIFLAGFFLAYGYIRTGKLWIPIGLHIGWNFFQGTIFGFQVSGTEGFNLIRHTVDGPEMITGGEFGPEAGMVSWVAMVLGFALIWWYTRDRTPAPDPKTQRTVNQPTDSAS